MNPADPHGSQPQLSDHLRRLEQAQHSLPPAPFDLDDIVRGGRRRHRRRVALQATAAGAAVAAVTTFIVAGPFGGPSSRPAPDLPAAPAPVVTSAPAPAPPVDAENSRVRYTQRGASVTASLDGTTIATIGVTSWSWSGDSGSVTLTVTATRPMTLAPGGFSVDGAEGYNENTATETRRLGVATGGQRLTLHFTGKGTPSGLSWVMDGPQDADGDGFVGLWELTAGNRTR
jgi:hypothetical protein